MRHHRSNLALAFLALTSHMPCQARAGTRRSITSTEVDAAVSSGIAGAGLATDSELSTAIAPLAASADVATALGNKLDTSTYNTKVAQLDKVAGQPITGVAGDTYTGSGGVDLFSGAFTLPFTPVDGESYGFNFDLHMSSASDDSPKGVVTLRNGQFRYDAAANAAAGGWVEEHKFIIDDSDLPAGVLA